MQHVMRDDVRHRASFGITIENANVRVWFCCRGAVIVSKEFHFIQVRVFLFLFCRHEWISNMLSWNTIRNLKS
jgi:hypothetical protein